MKSLLVAASLAALLVGCGEMGDKAIKGAAKAVLEEDASSGAPAQASQAPAQPELAQTTIQSTQPVQPVQVERVKPAQRVVPMEEIGAGSVGYVKTAKDGFVFMRDDPNSNATKTYKIYDGTRLTVDYCEGETQRRDNKAVGRWCRVYTDAGQIGYVFDKYIKF